MATTAEIERDKIGDRLDGLLLRLENEGLEIGIRDRVMAGRIAAHVVERQRDLSPGRRAFLLRARLTPALARSPNDVKRITRAFLDVFPEERPVDEIARVPPSRPPRQLTSLPGARRGERRLAVLAGLSITLLALAIGGMEILPRLLTHNPPNVVVPQPQPAPPQPATGGTQLNPIQPVNVLTAGQLGVFAEAIVQASAGSRNVSIGELASRLSAADLTGADARGMISLFQRYLPKAAGEPFTLDRTTLGFLVEAMASRRYPGHTVPMDVLSAVVAASGIDDLSDSPPPAWALPAPPEAFLVSPGLAAALIAAPGIVLIIWLVGHRRRLKDYLRRRTPERPPLVHELVVHASADIVGERTLLTRAALRLGRSRHGRSRVIDPEATANATAAAAGFPHVIFMPARATPEYLVLISSKGPEDHAARQLDRFVHDLAAQNLSLVRYFIAHDANICFESAQGAFRRIDELVGLYPDHRLIFLGTGGQLLNPGTLAVWLWPKRSLPGSGARF
jgi:hypothetical protein